LNFCACQRQSASGWPDLLLPLVFPALKRLFAIACFACAQKRTVAIYIFSTAPHTSSRYLIAANCCLGAGGLYQLRYFCARYAPCCRIAELGRYSVLEVRCDSSIGQELSVLVILILLCCCYDILVVTRRLSSGYQAPLAFVGHIHCHALPPRLQGCFPHLANSGGASSWLRW
jgi:hypothetical protein